jgi:predicted transcriptional regulator of viral defense system
MRYIDFQKQFKDYLIINLADIRGIYPDFDHRRLHEWQKSGYIKKVINNFYVFADKEFNEVEINYIANKLREPSYLSMEYALSYYSLIPETVFWRTSVSAKKTKKISGFLGNFSYQQIKSNLFFGYTLSRINKTSFKIAEPEKALLDFLYLRKDIKTADDFYELRLNKENCKKTINQKKLKNYLKLFNSKSLFQKIIIFNNNLK